ncbi:hypothetical protein PybrP1_003388 [[Pythium] brassicae (nom. inval.)]|nr:hypothetical protein PybrP1_003388 [[Pythium] brassicae (nom. inval.)]
MPCMDTHSSARGTPRRGTLGQIKSRGGRQPLRPPDDRDERLACAHICTLRSSCPFAQDDSVSRARIPRHSQRQATLRRLAAIRGARREYAVLRYFFGDVDQFKGDVDKCVNTEHEHFAAFQYCERPLYRQRAPRCMKLLHDHEYINKIEFTAHTRLPRATFFRLVDLVESSTSFTSDGSRDFRGGADLHLMVLLKCLGSSSNGST